MVFLEGIPDSLKCEFLMLMWLRVCVAFLDDNYMISYHEKKSMLYTVERQGVG